MVNPGNLLTIPKDIPQVSIPVVNRLVCRKRARGVRERRYKHSPMPGKNVF
jgi:hypothetical protein